MNLGKKEYNRKKSKEWYWKHREQSLATSRERRKAHPDDRKMQYWKMKNQWLEIIKTKDMDHCSICGYDRCFAAIDFHHVEDDKKYNIAAMITLKPTPERIAELSKVIPVCSNCHREIHNGCQ